MKFPLSLLKQFLDTTADIATLAETLTRIGLEVEAIEDKAASLAPFKVAHILTAAPHPNASKLQVCNVATTEGELQIVCGAPNARAGLKVALASIGTTIPTNGLVIKKSKIRDVESNGMLCSASELGLSDDAEGIIELPASAKIGDSIVDVLQLNDPVIELAITPNRGDCFGVYGVARDLAAAGIGTLTPLTAPKIVTGNTPPLSITITDHEGCPQFIGRRITGVKNSASPAWLQHALTAAGMRPISALVDVTNYFVLAYGRPLHVFDAAKVTGGITVRHGNDGETLEALNEKTYTLTAKDCVVADDTGALAIGGIMGGTDSGVTDATTDVILEVAYFDAVRIANTGRHHSILSDARTRFERGVDPAFLPLAAELATAMIMELCGGTAGEIVIAGNAPKARTPIHWSVDGIEKRSGLSVKKPDAERMLSALGFTVSGNTATPPSWRHDVTNDADIAEEVLRLIGYDNIPTVSLPKPEGQIAAAFTPAQTLAARTKRALVTRGLYETVSFAFISAEQAAMFGGVDASLQLQNPIAANLNTMRPNLLPNLLAAAKENLARGQAGVALFEMGSVFADISIRGETTVIAGIRVGKPTAAHWQPQSPDDLFAVKADVTCALTTYSVNTDNCQVTRNVPAWYHPGRAGALSLGPKTTLAYFGELHPSITASFDIDMPVYAFEIFIANVPTPKAAKRHAVALSEFQPTSRDFAFLVDDALEAGSLLKAMKRAAGDLAREVSLFDVYTGKGVPEGKRSLAISVTLQAMDRTLSEADITTASTAIIDAAKKLGAELRG